VETIKKAIDAMAMSKLNDLHWHITDDQSFPLCLDSYPQLCQKGMYRSAACQRKREKKKEKNRDREKERQIVNACKRERETYSECM